jgi:ribosomal protein S18 acetylase RimI-like enzyme
VAAVKLRPARSEDAPRLAALVDEAYGHYVERIGMKPRPMTYDYAKYVDEYEVTVAEDDGKMAGLVALGSDDEGFFVDNVAVHPSRQGTGAGRALLEHAEERARKAGFDSIYLFTHELMTENQALYERIGYTEYARRRPDGTATVVFMRKPLP